MAENVFSEISIHKKTTVFEAELIEKPQKISRVKSVLKYLGPAFIVSVAYMDPGNFATNISAGSIYNYSLIWVILCSNLMAIFLQGLSAKLGIASGHNLPQMCAKVFHKKLNWLLWGIAEVAAIATNLAEILGGTLGLYLLFNIPLVFAAIITGFLSFIIACLQKYGQRVIEIVIFSFVAVVCMAYAVELILSKPDWISVGIHAILPSIPDSRALYIAVGMLGATVMPHVIYLHSQLVQCRNKSCCDEDKVRHLKMERMDILVAMNIASIINVAIVIVSAAVFYKNGMVVETIEQAHKSLSPLVGALSSGAFGMALIASGLSSSAVGTMAGETIMRGFANKSIPSSVSRLLTIIPAILIIISGINPMKALVFSQVFLSFSLPAAIIPLIIISSRKDIMGFLVNKPITNVIGWVLTSIIVILNLMLIIVNLLGI